MRILFLDLDTLRPDHLGCYGYHRCTSPNIDTIARQGVRFDNYYCSDAPCLPSRAALMTGRFGIHTGVVGHGGTAADMRLEGESRKFADRMRRENLPAFLRLCGFRTVSISPFAERHSAWWFVAGFNEVYNTGRGGGESAEEITPVVLDWIGRNAKKDNWFLHVNYWDPHTPYRAPESFGNPFADEPLPAWLNAEVLEEHRRMVGPHKPREIAMYDNRTDPRYPRHIGEIKDMDDMRRFIDGYDCGIRYMDEHIGRLFQAFADQGVLDDLVVIISSDHGENMGELGIYGEHATADGITPHIPMIIRWPGAKEGHVDRGLHYNLDLAPTLAELLGRSPLAGWDGRSFAPCLQGNEAGREYLVLSQCAHVCQRAVRWGDWIYVRTYHDGYHLFPDEMLFNLTEDPHEQVNLAGERGDLCREAVYNLTAWHDTMMKTMNSDRDPLWTVIREGGPFHAKGHLKDYCRYLEETGRGDFIEELKRRHPREFR
ncbi:MAG TPA: sulfatase-like hydrolase/transferase [Firmicutes bacterium]|nr:sulfatase-like hydrolase/transferase [Bacillota bacterium]